MKILFSGIQPTGQLHIGNYLGAIKQWVELQDQYESIFSIVDYHGITSDFDPKTMSEKIINSAIDLLACGIDPAKSTLFVQSDVPQHTELAWILNNFCNVGELERMTQYKEKTAQHQENVALFDYPVLMAADILLYQTTDVPVGEDQKQHLELTRNLAERFNKKYACPPVPGDGRRGQTFIVPRYIASESAKRIMGLDDPSKKMSKSAISPYNYIALTDSAETICQKIKKAVTDSGTEIKAGTDKPAISNLLNIFSEITEQPIAKIEKEFKGKSYVEFKEVLAEKLIEFLKPIQEKYQEILKDEKSLRQILDDGAEKVAPLAQKTLKEVKEKIGLYC